MKLSENFTLAELTKSITATNLGIDNTPAKEQIENLRQLAVNVLQPARDALGKITINSGYRCEELNQRIGGAKNSQHKRGEAADIESKSNALLFDYIRENLDFDQLIWEFGNDNQPEWVHVSYSSTKNRNQVLVAVKEDGKTAYKSF